MPLARFTNKNTGRPIGVEASAVIAVEAAEGHGSEILFRGNSGVAYVIEPVEEVLNELDRINPPRPRPIARLVNFVRRILRRSRERRGKDDQTAPEEPAE